ncbi:MAG: biotin/lipoate A/B protein ligase family protein [Nitrospinales bacterium]
MTIVPWRIIEEGRDDGVLNMVTDRAVLQACNQGKAPPTLRLYGWKQPTLSIGYSQNAALQVDVARCRDLNIPIVRRPTGGRAVLHDAELTYCVVAPIRHPRFSGSLRQTFYKISHALMRGLDQLGIRETAINRQSRRGGRQDQTGSPACFAVCRPFETAVGNGKLIGSAQRRLHNAFLQHGSVLIDMNREQLNSLLRFENPEASRSHLRVLKRAAVTLNEICGRTVTFEEARKAFRDGFSKCFSEGSFRGELTAFELELRRRFLDTVDHDDIRTNKVLLKVKDAM